MLRLFILLVLVVVIYGVWKNQRSVAGGPGEGGLAACPSPPNCVCSTVPDEGHGIEAFTGSGDAIERLAVIVKALPRTRIVKQTETYLHVEFRSELLRFVDDVEFLYDEANGIVHVRSASRVGYSDRGVNRARVEQIRALYEAP